MIMKQIIPLIILIFLGIIIFSQQISAQESGLEIQFFYSKTCPNCATEEKFLDELEKKYPQLEIKKYEFSKNIELVKKFYQDYNVLPQKQGYVPVTFTATRYFVGFDEQIGKEIESCIRECLIGEEPLSQKTKIPIFGQIDIEKFSLPLLAVIFGFFDGFNVCSLGALVLILGLILALRSRKKILIFGGIFILTTAVVYGILIVLWHRLFSLLAPYQKVMSMLIAIAAAGGGIYFLKEFIKFKKGGAVCKTADSGIVTKFSSKIQDTLKNPKSIIAVVISVLIFAAVITIVEFPCSAAVPVVFAGILANAQLPGILYLLYIALFLIFYMLDEILVFSIALFTLKLWLASPKFVTWITLVEAIILFALGFYYLIGL